MNWEDAEAELERARRSGRALEFAIELWGRVPHQDLRSLARTAEQPVAIEPLKAWGAEGLQEWTTAFVQSRRPAPEARFQQLAALVEAATPRVAKQAFGFIAQESPDPRFGELLQGIATRRRALLETPSGLNEFFRALLPHADTGHLALVASLRDAVAMKLQREVSAKVELLQSVPAPPAGWGSRRAPGNTITARSAPEAESALWTRVYERPEDLAARAVLSDVLAERGDPRGPFIALQLAGDSGQPPPALIEALLGPIGFALRHETVRFERGFPVHGSVQGTLPARKLAVALLHREWATFRSLSVLPRLAPTLRSLEAAPDLSRQGVDEWIKKRWPIPLRSVGIPFNAIDRLARLPTPVEHLTLRWMYLRPPVELAPLFETLRGLQSLRTLTFELPMLAIEGPYVGWTSDVGDAWPVWTEQARAVPVLQSITWELMTHSLELTTERERFDTLRVVLGEHFQPRAVPMLAAQALKLIAATRRVVVAEAPMRAEAEAALARVGFDPTARGQR